MEKMENCVKNNKIDEKRTEHQQNRLMLYSEQFPQLKENIKDYIDRYTNKLKSLLHKD